MLKTSTLMRDIFSNLQIQCNHNKILANTLTKFTDYSYKNRVKNKQNNLEEQQSWSLILSYTKTYCRVSKVMMQ